MLAGSTNSILHCTPADCLQPYVGKVEGVLPQLVLVVLATFRLTMVLHVNIEVLFVNPFVSLNFLN